MLIGYTLGKCKHEGCMPDMAERVHKYSLLLTGFCFLRAGGADRGSPLFIIHKASIRSRILFAVIPAEWSLQKSSCASNFLASTISGVMRGFPSRKGGIGLRAGVLLSNWKP